MESDELQPNIAQALELAILEGVILASNQMNAAAQVLRSKHDLRHLTGRLVGADTSVTAFVRELQAEIERGYQAAHDTLNAALEAAIEADSQAADAVETL